MRMRLLPRSAANRIASVVFIAYALAILILGTAVFFATHTAFSRQIDATIEQTSRSLQAEYRDDGVRGVAEAISELRGREPISLGTALFTPDGQRLAGNLQTGMPPAGWHRIIFVDPIEGPDPARAKVTLLPDGHRLVVAVDLESLEAIDRTILSMFGAALAALLLLGLAGAFLLAAYLKRRLDGIKTTAEAIVAGDMAQRAIVGPAGDEFDRVAASLNAMLEKIAGLIANLRQVTDDLAHDMRTPLSRLRNQLERLRRSTDHAERVELVERSIAQAEEVLALFDAILRISDIEEGSRKRAFGDVDLSRLASDLGETLSLLADDTERSFDLDVAPGIVVQGDRELIAQAIINLSENAMRHTPPGSAIALRVAGSDTDASISVVDNGPGIPAADRERAQQRFVRLEAARSTPGHGLGLSLVRAIAEVHGAVLMLGDAGPGLTATITFPKRILL